MEQSILKEVSQGDLQAYLNGRMYDALYYPDFFPVKTTPFLSFDTIIGSKNSRVAADVVAYETSAPEKTRRTVDKMHGEIPAIRVKRIMSESDINLYNILKAGGVPNIAQILDLIYNDVDFCVDGVNARLEWICMQILSTGKVSLSKVNNGGGIVTETAIDFKMPPTNKKVCSAANQFWTLAAAATNDPISDIESIVSAAKLVGSKIAWINMNASKWLAFRASTAVKNMSIAASFVGGTAITYTPTLAQVNTALVAHQLPMIRIIDTVIGYENEDHSISYVDPWLDAAGADRYVSFTPDGPLGNCLAGPIAEETNPPKNVIQAKKGHILTSKWSSSDPVREFTKGETNAFFSWPSVDMCFILDTESNTTFGA